MTKTGNTIEIESYDTGDIKTRMPENKLPEMTEDPVVHITMDGKTYAIAISAREIRNSIVECGGGRGIITRLGASITRTSDRPSSS